MSRMLSKQPYPVDSNLHKLCHVNYVIYLSLSMIYLSMTKTESFMNFNSLVTVFYIQDLRK